MERLTESSSKSDAIWTHDHLAYLLWLHQSQRQTQLLQHPQVLEHTPGNVTPFLQFKPPKLLFRSFSTMTFIDHELFCL